MLKYLRYHKFLTIKNHKHLTVITETTLGKKLLKITEKVDIHN